MALDTVGDFVTQARVLLQDSVVPYRYPDSDFIFALNMAVLEARRYRADLYYANNTLGALPSYTATGNGVAIDPQYRPALLYYVAGYVGMRDAETEQDQRASAFMGAFKERLLAL
jgi:hypothetical protein